MEEKRETVISLMKACALSCKGDVNLDMLARDYITLNGSRIPYRDLGFTTLFDFIESVPGMSVTTERNGCQLIHVKSSSNTEHISRMIAAQKSAKKTPKFGNQSFYKHTYGSSGSSGHASSVTKPENSRYQGRNYDPNYRWKPPVDSGDSIAHRPWEKRDTNSDKRSSSYSQPRLDPHGKDNRYKGPCPVAPRFQAARYERVPSPVNEDNWDTDNAQDAEPNNEAHVSNSPYDEAPVSNSPDQDLYWREEGVAPADVNEAVEPEELHQEAAAGLDDCVYKPPERQVEPEVEGIVGLTPFELMRQARERQRLALESDPSLLKDKLPKAGDTRVAAEENSTGELTPFELMRQARERQRLASESDWSLLNNKLPKAGDTRVAAEENSTGELTPFELMRQARERQRLAMEEERDTVLRPPERYLDTLRQQAKVANMAEPVVRVREHESGNGYVCTIYVWLFAFESEVLPRVCCVEAAAFEALTGLQKMKLPFEHNYENPANSVNQLMKIIYTNHAGTWKRGVEDMFFNEYAEELPSNWADILMMNVGDLAVTLVRGPIDDIIKPKLIASVPRPLSDGGQHDMYEDAGNMGIIRHRGMRPIVNEPLHMPRTQLIRPCFRPPDYVPAFRGPVYVQPPGTLLPARFNPRARLNRQPQQLPALPSLSPGPPMATSTPNESDTSASNNSNPSLGTAIAKFSHGMVTVTHMVSTAEVWIRKADQANKNVYDNMCNELDLHYMTNVKTPVMPVVGQLFTMQVESCWHRVRLLNLDNSGVATVFFLDVGEEDKHNVKMLQNLDARFAVLPAQAFCVSLVGLDTLREFSHHVAFLVQHLVGRTFMARASMDADEDSKVIQVLLYRDNYLQISTNFWLTGKLVTTVPPPELPPIGQTVEAYLSHVNHKGQIFMQLVCEAYMVMRALFMQMLAMDIDLEQYRVSTVPVKAKRYVVRIPTGSGAFMRAVLVQPPKADGSVVVCYIDYGNVECTRIDYLYDFDDLTPAIEAIPPLATEVTLYHLPVVTDTMTQLMRGLVPTSQAVLMKLMTAGQLPEVELFRRIQPNNMLISVNNTLENDPRIKEECEIALQELATIIPKHRAPQELSSAFVAVPRGNRAIGTVVPINADKPPGNNFEVEEQMAQMCISPAASLSPAPVAAGSKVPANSLPPVFVPPAGSELDVIVSLVSSPSNFYVQRLKSKGSLEQLMKNLQAHYSVPQCPISPNDVHVGMAYASKQRDNFWYRCTVKRILGQEIYVSYSDFGNTSIVPLASLQFLDPAFMVLPRLACRAELFGVRPMHHDWSAEDCISFQKRMNSLLFVSVIHDVYTDPEGEMVLCLTLIDTSGSVDEHIVRTLVHEGRAVYTDERVVPQEL